MGWRRWMKNNWRDYLELDHRCVLVVNTGQLAQETAKRFPDAPYQSIQNFAWKIRGDHKRGRLKG